MQRYYNPVIYKFTNKFTNTENSLQTIVMVTIWKWVEFNVKVASTYINGWYKESLNLN